LAKISEAVAPTLPERFIGESSILDPKTHANVVDFNLFLQNEMCDMILLAAKTIRETAPRKRLSVVFYGYSITFSKTPNGPAYSGHYAFEKALKSPDIDIFTAPLDYFERLYGGVKCTQAPHASRPFARKTLARRGRQPHVACAKIGFAALCARPLASRPQGNRHGNEEKFGAGMRKKPYVVVDGLVRLRVVSRPRALECNEGI